MSLNIKNDLTCQLASELARLTGETMTGAITVALRERLDREKRVRSVEARVQAMRAIAKRCAKVLGPGPLAVEYGDLLYDERAVWTSDSYRCDVYLILKSCIYLIRVWIH